MLSFRNMGPEYWSVRVQISIHLHIYIYIYTRILRPPTTSLNSPQRTSLHRPFGRLGVLVPCERLT